jgi:hypothetical protein
VNGFRVPPKKFWLRQGWERYAIYCDEEQGPVFGVEADITVRARCNERRTNFARYFGNTFLNDTGIGGPPGMSMFLSGALDFLVNEIEVFEIKGLIV